jgi:hypothetical protein
MSGVDNVYAGSDSTERALANIRLRQAEARAAGVSSADFPSRHPIGSVLDDLSARPERAKVLGVDRVRRLLAHAEHFILDEDAGRRVVDMVEHHSPLIVDLREFAKLPFPTMTISLPTRATFDADRESLLLIQERDGIAKTFALVLRNTASGQIMPVPGWYVSTDSRDEGARTLIRLDDSMPDDETLRAQIGTYSFALDAVLLFLNQKRGIHISAPTERRRSFRNGRPTTFVARRTITLSLDNPADLHRSYATGDRNSPKRHGVRGHFFHRGGDQACEHRWAHLDGYDRGKAWECVDCSRRRFWRRDFERGDEAKGFVVSRYQIKGGCA